MADNLTLNAGSGGSVLAAQDESSVFYQEVKLTASGTGTTEALSKAEDTAHTTGEHGIMPLGVRRDADTSLVGADGDYAPFQVDANGYMKVEIFDGGGSHTVDNGGTFATQATLQAGTAEIGKLAAGTAAIGKLAANSGVDIGDVDVLSSALPSGAATSANQVAKATGGMSYTMLGIAAADNDVVIKASAATVYFISVQSIDATPVYLKLFDLASFTPGTSTADLQFMCPSQGTALGSGVVLNFGDHGIQFGTGLCALIATGFALDNNTAVSANEVIVTIGWE